MKHIRIIHFGPSGLTNIDPAFMGAGQMGAERKQFVNWCSGEMQAGFLPKSNWYVPGDNKPMEPHRFASQTRYEAIISLDALYKETGEKALPSDVILLKQGFEGYYIPHIGQVRLFITKGV